MQSLNTQQKCLGFTITSQPNPYNLSMNHNLSIYNQENCYTFGTTWSLSLRKMHRLSTIIGFTPHLYDYIICFKCCAFMLLSHIVLNNNRKRNIAKSRIPYKHYIYISSTTPSSTYKTITIEFLYYTIETHTIVNHYVQNVVRSFFSVLPFEKVVSVSLLIYLVI